MIDWSAVSSIVGIVGILIALIALLDEMRISRISLQTETLLSLDDKLHSPEMKQLRQIAAQKIINQDLQNDELGDVLEFLGGICFLIRFRAINPELAYRNFSWWIIRFWLSGEAYIREVRKLDPFSWVTMEKVVKELIKKERNQGYKLDSYSKAKLLEFCESETKIMLTVARNKLQTKKARKSPIDVQ